MHLEIVMAFKHNIVAYEIALIVIFCVIKQVFELLDLISLHLPLSYVPCLTWKHVHLSSCFIFPELMYGLH
jgi:hypothetical protein